MAAEPRKITVWSVIVGLAFLGGVAAGPGYYIYCAGFSGKRVDTRTLRESQGGYQPVEVALDPSMNPVRLELSATVRRSASRDQPVRFHVRLLDGGTVLMEKSISLEIKEKEPDRQSQATTVGTAQLPAGGRYVVQIGGGPARNSLSVSNLEIVVWRNARMPNMKIVWWGVGIMVASLVFGGLTGEVVRVDRRSV
jgi:hypothetical protein